MTLRGKRNNNENIMTAFTNQHFILYPLIITAITAGLYISGMPFGLIKYKIAVICLGVFFASVYIVSGNLLSIIVLHWLINISGSILFYYSNSNEPFAITKVFLFISIILSAWGLYIIKDYRGIW